jgi:membrane-bound ClpP family serine protease
MIILGVILLIIGLLVPGLSILFTIGIIVLIIGLVLLIVGQFHGPVGGRRYWYLPKTPLTPAASPSRCVTPTRWCPGAYS